MNVEKIAELSIGLGAAIGVLWIFLLMIREWKKKGNGNGHLTEDRVKLLINEATAETRHLLRNEMQVMSAKFENHIRDEIRNSRR